LHPAAGELSLFPRSLPMSVFLEQTKSGFVEMRNEISKGNKKLSPSVAISGAEKVREKFSLLTFTL
jgi:hypothetical protein